MNDSSVFRSIHFKPTSFLSLLRSAHSNAYFYGFWNKKCIVLFDTLLEKGLLPEKKDAKSAVVSSTEEKEDEAQEAKTEPEDEAQEAKTEPEDEAQEAKTEPEDEVQEAKTEPEDKPRPQQTKQVTSIFSSQS